MKAMPCAGAVLIALCALLPGASVSAAEPPAKAPPHGPARQAELEKQFMETLTGATLTGSFTVTGNTEEGQPKAESYNIESVTKLQDNLFLFRAKMKYRGQEMVVPMPLVVLWAGDTPVITLTDAAVMPGGTKYTARVMIYRDHYAGFWSSPRHGGHLYGTIERKK